MTCPRGCHGCAAGGCSAPKSNEMGLQTGQGEAEVPKELVCFMAHVVTLFKTLRTPAVQLDHQSPHQFQISVYWVLQNLTVPFDCETICRLWEQIS